MGVFCILSTLAIDDSRQNMSNPADGWFFVNAAEV